MKIEKEYKLLISAMDFQKMIDYYQVKPIMQTNYYYDTNPSLKDLNIAIRIREVNYRYIFTLKHQQDQLYEYEFEVAANNMDDERIQELLNKLSIDTPKLIGSMTTYRAIFIDDSGELCMDHNVYLDTEDFEVEYELHDANDDKIEHFNDLLKQFNLKYTSNCKSKIARFNDVLNQTKDA